MIPVGGFMMGRGICHEQEQSLTNKKGRKRPGRHRRSVSVAGDTSDVGNRTWSSSRHRVKSCLPAIAAGLCKVSASRSPGRSRDIHDTMHDTRRSAAAQATGSSAGYSTACVAAVATGQKSTPFVPRLTLRVGIENHHTAETVPTLPTLPRGVEQRGRFPTPPSTRARAPWKGPQGWKGWNR